MGYSRTSGDDLRARAAYRATTNTSYAYSAATSALPHHLRKAHETLDPQHLNADGKKIREARDSVEHPVSLPVFVAFDETGSMGMAPRLLQEKLASLKGTTLRLGLNDLQLGFGAWGDSQNNEAAPLQVGQFESGLEFEEVLNNIYLEGNGGGNHGETSGLLMWFLANYSSLDSYEKRGKKGYLFLVGDEVALPVVTKGEIERYVGETVQGDISIEEVFAQVTKMYDVFFLLYDTPAARQQSSLEFWTRHLGLQNVVPLQDLDSVAETIALVISTREGIAGATEALIAEGSDSKTVATIADSVVAKVSSGGTITTTSATGTISADSSDGVTFL